MNLESEVRVDRGAELREDVTVSHLKQQINCFGHNNAHNRRAKDYYVSRLLPSLQPINLSPDRYNSRRLLRRISEEFAACGMTSVDYADFRQGSSSNKPRGPQYYGSGLGDVRFDEDEDDHELLFDEGLARDGLYRGNYRNLVLLYTVVPLTTLLSFICLALVPTLLFTTEAPSLFPYPPYLPFPILEVLTATALWSLSYLLRDFLYATALFIASFLPSSTIIITILSAILQTTSNLLLRQIAIPILLIPYYSSKHFPQEYPTWEDGAFKRVWWVALGWAAAEAVVGVKQGYESIALYKDVLVNVNMSNVDTETGATSNRENQRQWLDQDLTSSPIQPTRYPRSNHLPTDEPPLLTSDEHHPLLTRANDEAERLQAENDVERDLDQLIALKNREELEEVYGTPVIRIPVFISCMHRINSIFSSLGICLLLTAAYMQSTFAITPPPSPIPSIGILFNQNFILSSHPATASSIPIALTTLPIPIIYTLLAVMHTPLILPRIGIHTFVYVELLISLVVFFGGLAVWNALS